ncbi:Ig-like domain-containing protein [Actinoplanes sp. NPDC026619]|uniref:beta strand repeat-containing protein n=1 Tax=Actinoplanes sp. NPDC026619 TaxID=3155798 RepID=UPI0033DFAE2D
MKGLGIRQAAAALIALGALMLAATALATHPAEAAITTPFTSRFDVNANGSILLRGNTVLTCPSSAACTAARNGSGTGAALNNNSYTMIYTDADGDPIGTFNDSNATITMPPGSSVLFAGLYWGATSALPSRSQVLFRTPAGSAWNSITASSLYVNSTFYQGFADVTGLVAGAGNGVYGVANIQAALGIGQYAGWSLAIAYRNPAEDLRSLRIYDGFGSIASGTLDIPITGFETPHSGTVHAKIGAVAYEGDLGNVGDSLQVDGQPLHDAANPANNFFNSTVSESGSLVTGRDPDYPNTLGFDIDQVDASGMFTNGQLSTKLTLTTSGDTYYPGVITFSIDLYAPKITTAVTSFDLNGGDLLPGDVLEYRIAVRNDGSDTADNVLVADAVPPHTTYVPGSLTGPGTFSGGTVSWQLGSIPYLGTTLVTFRVTVDNTTPAGYAITNLVNASYSGHTTSVSVAGLSGSAATPVLQPHLDRAATLTVSPTFLQRAALPEPVVYLATVTNVAGDLEPAARAVLTLPTGVTPGTLPAGCSAALPVVTCALGPLVGGSSASVPIPAVVDGTAADHPVASLRAAGSGADANGGNDTGTAALTVNRPPVAVADTATTTNGSAVSVPVLANDTDPDDAAGTLTVLAIVSGPAHGAAVIEAGGTITYTPVAGWAGADGFDYQVADPHGGTATARATVTTANAAPVANDDMINTLPNSAIQIDVLDNDSDPNPTDTLTVAGVTQPPPTAGTATFTSGDVTFTPTSSFGGTASFDYTISDGHGGTATATVRVDVANAAPTAADDVLTAPAGAAGLPLLVLANDTDPNNDALTVTAAGVADHGTATVAPDHLSVLYTAPAGFAGAATFTYDISDGNGGAGTATVTVTVANGRPTAYNFTVNTVHHTAVTLNAIVQSTDPNGDTLRVSGTTDPAHGTVSLDATGKITYLPDVAFAGSDTFSYTIDDGNGGTDTGTVSITVANAAAVARPDIATAAGGTPAVITVLANDDPDPNGDPLTMTIVGVAAHGTTSIGADRRITYTPDAGFVGTDTFGYRLDDGHGGTTSATVTVTTVNTAPVARADAAATDTNMAVVIAVLANDDDPNGDTIALDAAGTGGHGQVTDNHDGTLTYTPAAGFYGTDSFLYSIHDPSALTSSAIVTVTVRDAPPVAADDTFRVRPDVPTQLGLLANDTDPNTGQRLSVASVGPVAKGTVTLGTDGTVTYRAAAGSIGPDGFTYVLTDDLGRTDTGDVTITIDGAPTAVDDTATTASATAVDIRVVTNDTDPEALPLTLVTAGQPGDGSTRINPGGIVTYTPDSGFTGTDSFGYTIRDPIGNTATAQVRVRVANAVPVARPDVAAGLADRPLYVDVLANDSDPNPGQTLAIDGVGNPAHGTAEVAAGRVRFLPERGWTGQDTFGYRISDGHGGLGGSTITVTISGGAPIAVADEGTTAYRKPVTLRVLANDLDPAGTLKVDSVTQPAKGTASHTESSVTYTPPDGFGGPATFAYSATDDAGHHTGAAVTVTVGAPPTVPDKSATTKPGDPIDVPLPHTEKGGRSVTVISVGKPAHGSAVLNADGTVTYTPDPGFNGVDTFTYDVVDPDGNVATASIIVTVASPAAANQPPIAAADTVTMAAGDTVVVRPTLNDSDPDGDPVTIVKLGKPAHGAVLAGAGDTVSYRPADDFASGEDSFDYTIADGRGGLATATVTIHVRELDSLPTTGSNALVLARAGLFAIAVGAVVYWLGLPGKKRADL